MGHCYVHFAFLFTLRAWDTDHDEAMEEGGREFDPRPGYYSRMSF